MIPPLRYRDAGVDIQAGEDVVRRIKDRVRSTFGPNILTELGAFGGVCTIPGGDPDLLLVSSVDGVGTKLKVASMLNRYDTVGEDLVNHCCGDIGVHGARPLFFLDYVGMGKLSPEVVEGVVEGMVRGCVANGCALIGGETAEMPGVYTPPDFDLVGCIVGTVRREDFVDGSTLAPGDILVGYPSTGLHTNGYSLARRVLFEIAGVAPDDPVPGSGARVGDALLAVHRSYLSALVGLKGLMKGAAHITGGGIPGNLARVLPPGTAARIDLATWVVPPLFRLIRDGGEIPRDEMYHTFNMGVGLIVGVAPERVAEALEKGAGDGFVIGALAEGDRQVELEGGLAPMVTGGEVRVGVVGAGAIAQLSHLPAYARIPEARITALCDTDLSKARRVAGRYNVARVTDSYQELVAMDEVDVVDICLPNHLHAPATLAALAAGKHVLCEKPFSRSSEEAEQMVTAARKQGLVLMSGFNNRFREDAVVLKRFLAEGELGTVFYAKTGWLMQPSSWSGTSWKSKKRYAGGGVLLDLGIQMLDLTLWLLNMPEVDTVTATAHPKPQGEEVETASSALLRLRDGGTVTLEVSWGLLMEKDFAYLNLFGDRGAALLNPLRVHKEMHDSLVNVTPALSTGRNTYRLSFESEIRHFLECARTGAPPLSSGDDALTMLRLLEALYRSARDGREVRLG